MYNEFYIAFLLESPQRVQGANSFEYQKDMILSNIRNGLDVHLVANAIYKLDSGNGQITYWIGNDTGSNISIIVDTIVNGRFCKVSLTSKNPSMAKGTAPYASDLYLAIKSDIVNKSLTFTSDNILSDDAERLWKRLSTNGNTLSVYDSANKQYVMSPIQSSNDLDRYISNDTSKKQYIFTLSENKSYQSGLIHGFKLLEIKRLIGYPEPVEF